MAAGSNAKSRISTSQPSSGSGEAIDGDAVAITGEASTTVPPVDAAGEAIAAGQWFSSPSPAGGVASWASVYVPNPRTSTKAAANGNSNRRMPSPPEMV